MTVGHPQNKIFEAYRDYIPSIELLEKTFRATGMKIDFELTLSDFGNKWISITEGSRPPHTVSIEGDNPIMALKDIAAAVRW